MNLFVECLIYSCCAQRISAISSNTVGLYLMSGVFFVAFLGNTLQNLPFPPLTHTIPSFSSSLSSPCSTHQNCLRFKTRFLSPSLQFLKQKALQEKALLRVLCVPVVGCLCPCVGAWRLGGQSGDVGQRVSCQAKEKAKQAPRKVGIKHLLLCLQLQLGLCCAASLEVSKAKPLSLHSSCVIHLMWLQPQLT